MHFHSLIWNQTLYNNYAQRIVATNLIFSSSKQSNFRSLRCIYLKSSWLSPNNCIDQTLNGVHVPHQFSILSKNFTFVFHDVATKIDPSIIVTAKRIVARQFKSQNNIRSLRCIQKDHVSNSNALIKHWKGWHVPFSSETFYHPSAPWKFSTSSSGSCWSSLLLISCGVLMESVEDT